MKLLGNVIKDALVERERERERTRQRIEGFGDDPTRFLKNDYPPLVEVVPPSANAALLAEHARWHLREACSRLRQCAGCPDTGGACESTGVYYAEGLVPVWQESTGLGKAECAKWQRFEIRRRLRAVGVADTLLDASLADFQPRDESQRVALDQCKHYVEAARGKRLRESILFQGASGTGKTHLAVAVLRELCRRYSTLFAYVPLFLDEIRRQWWQHEESVLFEQAMTVGLLVLDDVGAETPSRLAREKLEVIVTTRSAEGRPLLVTSNEPFDRLEDRLGTPVVRRLLDLPGQYVELDEAS